LLTAIDARGKDESRPNQACPATFLQAMGEREYENPLASLSNGSRTQLWKPSRSWWEAKSGKNPWIEPKSHNKRWRYLWPLIHYHKFLAKCIKKLKRNQVDVKMSVSPVAAFLREEICAVSDHLAAVSLFDSDEWMKCLGHFNGWTDTSGESENRLRTLVSKLKLRPLNEPGDVDSPLLRSQIDEQFLRAMVTARKHMESGGDSAERRKPSQNSQGRDAAIQQSSNEILPSNLQQPQSKQHAYPSQPSSSPYSHIPSHVSGQQRNSAGVRRSRLGYPYQWWGQGYGGPPQYAYGDDNVSVHSSLSGEAFNDFSAYTTATPLGGFYPPVFPPHAYSDHDPNIAENPMYYLPEAYSHEQVVHAGLAWVGQPPFDPGTAYALPQNLDSQGYYATPAAPPSPHEGQSPYNVPLSDGIVGCNHSRHMESHPGGQTPYKYDPNNIPLSPFWAHLDRATLAMGLATPQTNPPKTPHRQEDEKKISENEVDDGKCMDAQESDVGFAGNAQPLLLRQSQYYGYGPYGPPSPATQFMMSPQASFAYNYGYGYSPARHNSNGRGFVKQISPVHIDNSNSQGEQDDNVSTKKISTLGILHPQSVSKVVSEDSRESPSTVGTTAETESLGNA